MKNRMKGTISHGEAQDNPCGIVGDYHEAFVI